MTGELQDYFTVSWYWDKIFVELHETLFEECNITNQEELEAWMLANYFPVPTNFEIRDSCDLFLCNDMRVMVPESACRWEVSWTGCWLYLSLDSSLTLPLKEPMTPARFEQWQKGGGAIIPSFKLSERSVKQPNGDVMWVEVGEYSSCSGGAVMFDEIVEEAEDEEEARSE